VSLYSGNRIAKDTASSSLSSSTCKPSFEQKPKRSNDELFPVAKCKRISMSVQRVLGLIFFTFAVIASQHVYASSWVLPYDIKIFKGVTQITIAGSADNYNPQLNPFRANYSIAASKALKEVFKDYPQFTVIDYKASEPRTDTVYINFMFDFNKVRLGDEDRVIGALTYKMVRFDESKKINYIPITFHVSYPFVLPATKEEMDEIVYEGVKDILAGLPILVACGNVEDKDLPPCIDKAIGEKKWP